MKLLNIEKTDDYHEIEIEYSFLFIKYKRKYRKVGSTIFDYEKPNNYKNIGFNEHCDVKGLFDVKIMD